MTITGQLQVAIFWVALSFTLIGCTEGLEPAGSGSDEAQIAADNVAMATCPAAISTPEMEQCYGGLVRKAEQRRAKYLALAIERHDYMPSLATQITESDAAFQVYREMECDSVLDSFGGSGTIRGVARQWCVIDLTDARTLTIWDNWLQYADSTPPDLPKPEPHLK